MSNIQHDIVVEKDVEAVKQLYEYEHKDCEETSGLQILNQFKNLYESRIRNIDPNDPNKAEVKMKIMTEWIQDLDAQNTMLVRTIEELEEAACCRVKMLEEKLKYTSNVLSENMSQFTRPSHDNLNELSNRITRLERDENNLQRKIKYLQSDIRGLLELIRRAEIEKRWRLDGLKFFEILPTDIPIPESSYNQAMGDGENIEFLMQRLQSLDGDEKKSLEYQYQLQQNVNHLNKKLQMKEDKMQNLIDKFDYFKDKLKNQSTLNTDNKKMLQIIEMLDSVQSELIVEKHKNEDEKIIDKEEIIDDDNSVQFMDQKIVVSLLKSELADKSKDIKRLTDTVNTLEKELNESREALTQEVAEKHDTIITLKDKVMCLEEQLRESKLQLQFKIDIIKEMRRKMITANTPSNTPQRVHFNSNALAQKVSWSDDLSDVDTEKVKAEEMQYENDGRYNLEANEKMLKMLEISKQQFNSMEEFRICTVEAQAATEDLREEISNVTSSLYCRYQLLIDLNNSFEKMHDAVSKTKDNLSNVIKNFKIQIEENAVSKNTILMREIKLKDIKNEINQARAKMSSLTGCDEIAHSRNPSPDIETCDRLLNRLVDEVDYIICNLGIYISKEDYTLAILNQVYDQLYGIERNLEELLRKTNQVLQDNETAQKVLADKTKRLDKLEKELDYAHTKMQEALENIVFLNQQKETADYHHLHHHQSVNIVETPSPANNKSENGSPWNAEMEQLQSALFSKDKLIEHKDEIIRIQKDSIDITQREVIDLQSKIDAQAIVINQYVEDRNNLLEQNSLQKETIRHLQNAIVQAKKSVNRQQPQKSGIDLAVSDVWSPITPTVFNNDDVHDV